MENSATPRYPTVCMPASMPNVGETRGGRLSCSQPIISKSLEGWRRKKRTILTSESDGDMWGRKRGKLPKDRGLANTGVTGKEVRAEEGGRNGCAGSCKWDYKDVTPEECEEAYRTFSSLKRHGRWCTVISRSVNVKAKARTCAKGQRSKWNCTFTFHIPLIRMEWISKLAYEKKKRVLRLLVWHLLVWIDPWWRKYRCTSWVCWIGEENTKTDQEQYRRWVWVSEAAHPQVPCWTEALHSQSSTSQSNNRCHFLRNDVRWWEWRHFITNTGRTKTISTTFSPKASSGREGWMKPSGEKVVEIVFVLPVFVIKLIWMDCHLMLYYSCTWLFEKKKNEWRMGLVRITSWYPEFNGSHFGLPPSSIHQMTGLGGKMVWTMMFLHIPHLYQLNDWTGW